MLSGSLNYPIEYVQEKADMGGLAYYAYSEELFLSLATFNPEGLPLVNYPRIGVQWNPAYVAWWALMGATAQALGRDQAGIDRLMAGARWLLANARDCGDGSAVWFYSFRWREGKALLEPPWISSISQGLAISSLLRAYRVKEEREYLDLAVRAAIPFSEDVDMGGLQTRFGDAFMYEEYPARPYSRVLDGSIFGLLGLYDLYCETGEKGHEELFQKGLDGIKRNIEYWDYRKKWSWYGAHGYLCSPMYNKLNSVLMKVLHAITSDPVFERYSLYWDPGNLSIFDSLEIRIVYMVTIFLLRGRLLLARAASGDKAQ